MLECSRTPKCKDTSGGADKGEGPLGIQVQGDGTRIKPVLDLIDMEPEEAPIDRPARPARPKAITENYQSS
jgi:hypothetical protein